MKIFNILKTFQSRTFFILLKLQHFCLVNRALSYASAYSLHCCPTFISNIFIIIKTADESSLKIPAAMYAAISIILIQAWKCFRDNRHTVALKLSFEFYVCLPKNLWSKSLFHKPLWIDKLWFCTSGARGGGCWNSFFLPAAPATHHLYHAVS